MAPTVYIPPKVTQLSRSEVMSLLYDKLTTIRDECDVLIDPDANDWRDLPQAKERLKRIALEARRAAALIDTHEICSKAGHCLHCGKAYEEHDEQRSEGARAKVPSNKDPRCMALKRFFESMEIETYQGVQIVEVG